MCLKEDRTVLWLRLTDQVQEKETAVERKHAMALRSEVGAGEVPLHVCPAIFHNHERFIHC